MVFLFAVIGKPTLDDIADEDNEGEDMQADDDYTYDDDENSAQDRSTQEDITPAVLQQADYSIRKKVGDDVTLTCDVKNIGSKISFLKFHSFN